MASTKNLGARTKLPVRLGEQTMEAAEQIAKLVPMPINSVIALGVISLAAQYAPLLTKNGLSLDLLEEDYRAVFAEARRIVATKPVVSRK